MPQKSKEEKKRFELITKIRKEIDAFPRIKRGYSKEQEELIDLHITLGYLYSDLPRFYDQSLLEFSIALSLSEELRDRSKQAHINGIIASMHLVRLNYSQAIFYYENSIELLQTDTFNKEMMIAKKGLGIAYLRSGQSDSAITRLTEAAEICVELGDANNYMEIITILHTHFKKQGKWDMVILLEEKALKILFDMGVDEEISRSYMDLGIAYTNLKKYDYSLTNFKHAVNYAIKTENNLLIYQGILLVAETLFHLRDILGAKKEYFQALSMAVYLGWKDEIKKTKMVLLTLGASEQEITDAEDIGKKEMEKS